MILTMDGQLRLKDVPPSLFQEIVAKCTLPNPDYQNALRLGRPTYNIPRTLQLFEVQNNEVLLPRGLALWLWSRRPAGTARHDKMLTLPPVEYHSSITLRDYQAPVVDAVLGSHTPQGVILAPCGSGKTEMGLDLIARIGQPALWITHTHDLQQQTMERARLRLGLGPGELGQIGDGKVQPGTHLTVATVQTLYRTEMEDLAERFGLVMVDECHRCVSNPEKASMFARVLACLPARYRYGLTASPTRADGMETTMQMLLGEPLAQVAPESLEAAGNIIRPTVQPVYTGFGYTPAAREARIDQNRLLRKMADDPSRCELIAGLIVSELQRGASCLVLAQHLDLLKTLWQAVGAAGLCAEYITGATKKADRAASLNAVRRGSSRCLFATYQLAKEGLDIPRLDRLFLASPVRDAVTIQQSVGRIMRPAPGKTDALCYDFVDERTPVCKSQYAARKRVYKNLKATIKKEI